MIVLKVYKHSFFCALDIWTKLVHVLLLKADFEQRKTLHQYPKMVSYDFLSNREVHYVY